MTVSVVDLDAGEWLGYVYGRLADEPEAPPAHMVLLLEPDPNKTVDNPNDFLFSYRVKKCLASCTSVEAATAAGRLLSGKAGREW